MPGAVLSPPGPVPLRSATSRHGDIIPALSSFPLRRVPVWGAAVPFSHVLFEGILASSRENSPALPSSVPTAGAFEPLRRRRRGASKTESPEIPGAWFRRRWPVALGGAGVARAIGIFLAWVARAWRGRCAGYRHFFLAWWRGHGAGVARACPALWRRRRAAGTTAVPKAPQLAPKAPPMAPEVPKCPHNHWARLGGAYVVRTHAVAIPALEAASLTMDTAWGCASALLFSAFLSGGGGQEPGVTQKYGKCGVRGGARNNTEQHRVPRI
eukprot:gene23773-biopygen16372